MILWQFIAWYNLWSRGGIGVSYVSISYYWSFHMFGPINLRSQIHGWGFTMGTLSIHNKQKDELEYIEMSKWVFKMATIVAKFCTTKLFRSVASSTMHADYQYTQKKERVLTLWGSLPTTEGERLRDTKTDRWKREAATATEARGNDGDGSSRRRCRRRSDRLGMRVWEWERARLLVRERDKWEGETESERETFEVWT